ncbi:GPGG-motif small membrane protein [Nocardiopsis sediminis]|uniref:GPGG-motif small membrane protein n=1 Tax=Nocardiopsis sediminis TaxID=1778267 RepID=A0ABV8FM15_9ACTN
MGALFLVLGVVLILAGAYALLRRRILWGVLLVVIGLAIAPANLYYPG